MNINLNMTDNLKHNKCSNMTERSHRQARATALQTRASQIVPEPGLSPILFLA